MFGKATLDDLDYSNYDMNDNKSNLLDNSYEFNDKEFHEELDNENKLNNEHGVGNKETQADYFVNDSDDSKSDENSNVNQEPETEEVSGNQEVHEDQEVHENNKVDKKTHGATVSDSNSGNESELMDVLKLWLACTKRFLITL